MAPCVPHKSPPSQNRLWQYPHERTCLHASLAATCTALDSEARVASDFRTSPNCEFSQSNRLKIAPAHLIYALPSVGDFSGSFILYSELSLARVSAIRGLSVSSLQALSKNKS